ncbi:Porphobilinogen deaminase [Croceitalea dokdonensis DOKDO 023]|uniref:Hydroxymethylbilane synthase n=1 Tax=Croceitalea dokdonensis DOKDO 023 TaxID=1300341 RepID=A0A0P7AR64_9FLAO|nr:hydroxymethylbilane synthase [Croceitalea dokdonensis]KPM31085.1 Porphobilinogen deaminase [Croceitalea dokdonensis DOKDO 023]
MSKVIRIGTRDSELALWQANTVQEKLETLGHNTTLVPVKSAGDLVLDKPLYDMGITGIFTKSLDIALLKGDIDIAVHSMKDVPTQLPKGVVKTAVLERAVSTDILVHKGTDFLEGKGTIATGSLRRKAQWLAKYPKHKMVDLRGNVNSRLIKLIENDWNGAIFAKAGLERIKLLPKDAVALDWMVPAPAQGAMLVVALEKNTEVVAATASLNHTASDIATAIEREFLRTLEGGCTAPIGALATIKDDTVYFKGCLHALDGSTFVEVIKERPLGKVAGFGKSCAYEVLERGGKQLMEDIKNELNNTVH